MQGTQTSALTVSVVLPLVDARGAAIQAVTSWLAQRTAENPFEIVVVDHGQVPHLARHVKSMLGPLDQFVSCRSENEAVLYNAGARSARGDLLVFTEAHVLGQPGAISAIRKHFTIHADEAACLASAHLTRTPMARLDAWLSDQETPAMQALGTWRCVSLRGFAIRTRVFHNFGRFQEVLGRFAETALAVRLDSAGCRIGFIPEAVVGHVDPETPAQLFPAMRLGAKGECAWWELEPVLARRYFGANPPWAAEPTLSSRLAWRIGCDLLHLLCRERGRPGWGSQFWATLGLLPRLAISASLNWRIRRLMARLGVCLATLRLWNRLSTMPISREKWGEPATRYLALRRACARCGVVEFLAERSRCAERVAAAKRTFSMADFSNDGLLGFFTPEQWHGETYRWSGPVGILLLALEKVACRIRIDIRPTGTWKVRHPHLFFNGHHIPPDSIDEADGHLIIKVHDWMFVPDARQRLTFTCEPFVPARHGLPDRRVLGVAIISLSVDYQTDDGMN